MKKRQKNNLFYYIACNNPSGSIMLIKKEGFAHRPKNKYEAAMMLADIVKKNPEQGLKEVAKIHPDRELIQETIEKPITTPEKDKEENLYAEGTKEQKFKIPTKTLNVMIVSGAAILAVSMITIIATRR